MATNTLDNQLQHYLQLMGMDDKKLIIAYIKSIIMPKEAPKRLTIQEYNRELDAAEARMDAGDFISHEDAVKQAETWI